MSHLPWFPFYHHDWKRSRSVRQMPRHCRSMFLDLLSEQWEQGPLPDDQESIAGLLGEDPKTFAKDWSRLRRCFDEVAPGLLENRRLEEIRSEQLEKNAKQANRAKSGWDTRRANKRRQSGGDAAASPDESRGYAISDPRSQMGEEDLSHAGARVIEPPTPAARLASAWSNGGLHGMPSRDQLSPLAEALDELMIHPLEACKAWCALLKGWRDGSRNVVTKQTPEKMLEHLRAGLIEQVIKGEIDPARLAEPPRDMRPSVTTVSKRTTKTAAEVLEEEETYRQRLNEERELAVGE